MEGLDTHSYFQNDCITKFSNKATFQKNICLWGFYDILKFLSNKIIMFLFNSLFIEKTIAIIFYISFYICIKSPSIFWFPYLQCPILAQSLVILIIPDTKTTFCRTFCPIFNFPDSTIFYFTFFPKWNSQHPFPNCHYVVWYHHLKAKGPKKSMQKSDQLQIYNLINFQLLKRPRIFEICLCKELISLHFYDKGFQMRCFGHDLSQLTKKSWTAFKKIQYPKFNSITLYLYYLWTGTWSREHRDECCACCCCWPAVWHQYGLCFIPAPQLTLHSLHSPTIHLTKTILFSPGRRARQPIKVCITFLN